MKSAVWVIAFVSVALVTSVLPTPVMMERSSPSLYGQASLLLAPFEALPASVISPSTWPTIGTGYGCKCAVSYCWTWDFRGELPFGQLRTLVNAPVLTAAFIRPGD